MASKKKTPKKKEPVTQSAQAPNDSTYKMISLDLIDDPARPMRTDMTEASVEDLVLSIKQVGIIEPIIVKPKGRRYEVIAGHRRTFAANIAKLPMVPCFIKVASDDETEMLKIHENLYRESIKPADEAQHFDYLIQKQKMTPNKIAGLIGKSPSYVRDRLAILNYPDFLKEAMDKGQISFSVAREFARFDNVDQMRKAVYYAKRSGMTQELARKWVLEHKRAVEQPQITPSPNQSGNGESAPVEHSTTCIFCKQSLRLLEAQVVYMHDHCLHEASAIEIPEPEAQPKTKA